MSESALERSPSGAGSADPRPANTPWLTPYLCVRDTRASTTFYEKAFGFAVREHVDDDGATLHVEMTWQGQLILMFAPEGAFGSTALTPRTSRTEPPHLFYLYVEDVDAAHARVVDAGGLSIMAPQDSFWGDRFCQIEDLDGYRWGLASRGSSAPKP
jgi:uncharacterized glyoxalase superfamily protein PhnB